MIESLSQSQQRILEALNKNGELTYEELVELTGMSYSGVTSRITELIRMGFNIQRMRDGLNTVLRYDGDYESEDKGGRKQISALDRVKSANDFYEIKDILDDLKDKKPSYKLKKAKKFKGKKCGMLVLSDLHFGQIVLNEEGEEIYNTEKAVESLRTLASSVIDKMIDNDLSNIYIGMIGDMVDGDNIYRNHMFYVEKPAIEQIKDVTKALTEFINTLETAGFNIHIGCVRGNHGITNYKNLEVDNWDNVVYDMLSLVFKDNKNVHIDHFSSDTAKVNVLDKQVVLSHGQEMGPQIKTASGLKTFRGICNKYRLNDGDFMVVGHLHEFGVEGDQNRYLIRNGALPYASEYAMKLNFFGEPMQTFLIINEGQHYPMICPIQVN